MPLKYTTAWVTIAAHNFDTIVEFYAQLLGCPPDRVMGPADALIYVEFELHGLRLGIYRPALGPTLGPALAPTLGPTLGPTLAPALGLSATFTSGPISICLQVECLEVAIDHLASIGYPVSGAILTPRHGREIYAFDPDGNRLILYQPH
jgi:predicted enzyme related to lactoylglutathione lyase